ncbi:DUF2924 domain-containing protein [Bartonella sp. CM120XJJH]|uniref:DUF2924 domain-containing protein n=1 Tax=Bartonella sp. CM120XJJH TaxID=3243544 RepID=UPI0035D03D41
MNSRLKNERARKRKVPVVGTQLCRDNYLGQTHHVLVVPKGYQYESKIYKGLSAIFKHITGIN